jgi:predicted metal-dependent hydrolase
VTLTASALGLPCGTLHFIRKSRVKNLRITVRPDRTIVVTVPWLCSMAYAETYVQSKKAWIEKVFRRLDTADCNHKAKPLNQIELKQGQVRLFERLKELALQHGFFYRKAAFRNQKTRWGSCSSRNHISLNIHLLTLPTHLQDYVLLHELAHTEHKNHSKAFWTRLDELLSGKARQYNKELRNYRVGVAIR